MEQRALEQTLRCSVSPQKTLLTRCWGRSVPFSLIPALFVRSLTPGGFSLLAGDRWPPAPASCLYRKPDSSDITFLLLFSRAHFILEPCKIFSFPVFKYVSGVMLWKTTLLQSLSCHGAICEVNVRKDERGPPKLLSYVHSVREREGWS